MKRYYVEYDSQVESWDVYESGPDGGIVDSFYYEADAASYCDHLNENDY